MFDVNWAVPGGYDLIIPPANIVFALQLQPVQNKHKFGSSFPINHVLDFM